MLELDALGRAHQNAAYFSKALSDYEIACGGSCTNVTFDRLQEPGFVTGRYVRIYTMEGLSQTCGRRVYQTRITFADAAHTVAKRVEVLLGPDEETQFREKAMEFIRFAQAGDVRQMLSITSPLSHATETDSLRTLYAEQVVPQFRGATVKWEPTSQPSLDERKNVGLVFTGTAQGMKTFAFDVAVYKEDGKSVIANIQKRH